MERLTHTQMKMEIFFINSLLNSVVETNYLYVNDGGSIRGVNFGFINPPTMSGANITVNTIPDNALSSNVLSSTISHKIFCQNSLYFISLLIFVAFIIILYLPSNRG